MIPAEIWLIAATISIVVAIWFIAVVIVAFHFIIKNDFKSERQSITKEEMDILKRRRDK